MPKDSFGKTILSALGTGVSALAGGIPGAIGSGILGGIAGRGAFSRENRYNHPAAQMARLKEAGLSPWLMYGKGGGIAESASMDTPKMELEGMENLGKQAQISVHNAQKELINAQARKANAEADIIEGKRNYNLNTIGFDAETDIFQPEAGMNRQQRRLIIKDQESRIARDLAKLKYDRYSADQKNAIYRDVMSTTIKYAESMMAPERVKLLKEGLTNARYRNQVYRIIDNADKGLTAPDFLKLFLNLFTNK